MFSFDSLESRRLMSGTFVAKSGQFDVDPVPGPQVLISFNQDVDMDTAWNEDLRIINTATGEALPAVAQGVSYNSSSRTVGWIFRGALPDGQYRAVLPAGSVSSTDGQPLGADATVEFFALGGDATRDGRVNLDDFNVLAANFGQSPRRFTQGDFNYDGRVNLTDFDLLASRFGKSIVTAGSGASPLAGQSSTAADDRTAADVLA